MSRFLRSALFLAGMVLFTVVYFFVALLTLPFNLKIRYYVVARIWSRAMLGWLRLTCGVKYRVIGWENVPATPVVVLSKHQSAWETLAFQSIFPPLAWVLKRELLRIPIFGWALAVVGPIAIDRGSGREALRQMVAQGKARLAKGIWVVVFPEGTRVNPGEKGKYNIGGAWLATHAGVPVLPIAHNAGTFWGRNAFLKYPGTITLSIGKPIDGTGMKADELNGRVEHWIEAEMARINGRRSKGA